MTELNRFGDIRDALRERNTAEKRIAKLEAALREHHRWQQESGVWLTPSDDGPIEINNAAEYNDSGMCERTIAALEHSLGAPEQRNESERKVSEAAMAFEALSRTLRDVERERDELRFTLNRHCPKHGIDPDYADDLWWVSVGGGDCEPARVVDGQVYTIGCSDPTKLTPDCGIELVEKMENSFGIPLTEVQKAAKAAAWEAQRAADRKRGVTHGYRRFP